MARHSKAEIAKADADCEWWRSFCALFGWRLYGFSYRQWASVFTQHNRMLRFHASDVADILAAIERAREEGVKNA